MGCDYTSACACVGMLWGDLYLYHVYLLRGGLEIVNLVLF